MYNKRLIIPGLIIFVALVTSPFWYNALSAGTMPKVEPPPGGEQNCVRPLAEMKASHMKVLDQWKDEVTRENKRELIVVDGKEYGKGLQLACMQCHSNKEKFCDTCHEYASVKPYCWDCHLSPAEIASKKETL